MTLPPLQRDCPKLFGDPSAHGWESQHIRHVAVPWRMHCGGLPIGAIRVNAVAAPSLAEALRNVWEACRRDQQEIEARGYDVFSGDWAIRPIRGGSAPSMHSFALAIDFNAPRNPLGKPESETLFKNNDLLLTKFKQVGWIAGADFPHRRDAMHVQFARFK